MEYGCIGEKLSHSFSREIHGALTDYKYELMEIPRDKLKEFMESRDFKAINVTIPYKQAVIPYLYSIDSTAQKIGAVNTVVNRNGRLYGYNTDFNGLTALIKRENIELACKKVLILGSGGTSKTAFAVAEHLGAARVFRVSRSAREDCISYDDAVNHCGDAEVIINTTPCGMYPDIGKTPLDIERFAKLEGVIDAIYNPLRSALVTAASEKGIKAAGGLYMLVSQAAAAAEIFLDKTFEISDLEKVYQQILRQKENIVLVGMPGCGKSTIGKEVADRLGMEFIDTDSEIEKLCGRSITEIFKTDGEQAFRSIEADVIKNLAAKQHTVIATGGGAILKRENILNLKANGRIYFIDRPLDYLVTTPDRPLSSSRESLEKRYAERYDKYIACCDCRIAALQDLEENIKTIIREFLE